MRNRKRSEAVSVHASDKVVNFVFTVSEVTSLDEVVVNTSVATSGGRELEGPQEVVSLKKFFRFFLETYQVR